MRARRLALGSRRLASFSAPLRTLLANSVLALLLSRVAPAAGHMLVHHATPVPPLADVAHSTAANRNPQPR
jgi:hypothetical protein